MALKKTIKKTGETIFSNNLNPHPDFFKRLAFFIDVEKLKLVKH